MNRLHLLKVLIMHSSPIYSRRKKPVKLCHKKISPWNAYLIKNNGSISWPSACKPEQHYHQLTFLHYSSSQTRQNAVNYLNILHTVSCTIEILKKKDIALKMHTYSHAHTCMCVWNYYQGLEMHRKKHFIQNPLTQLQTATLIICQFKKNRIGMTMTILENTL